MRSPLQERGNEDHTSDTGITPTGDPVTEGVASSTQSTRGPPQEGDDPRYDDADYLFGRDGEGKNATLGSMVARDTSTGSRATGGAGNRPTVQDNIGLVERICAVDVCEVFSPPRVTAEAARFGMSAGDAMDLTTGWGFNIPEHRHKAEQYADQEKPRVLIGSPPCVASSQLQ